MFSEKRKRIRLRSTAHVWAFERNEAVAAAELVAQESGLPGLPRPGDENRRERAAGPSDRDSQCARHELHAGHLISCKSNIKDSICRPLEFA
jgi:hypothetical protein